MLSYGRSECFFFIPFELLILVVGDDGRIIYVQFWKSGSTVDVVEFIQAVNDVLSTLNGYQKKFVFILADEIYVKSKI